MSTFWVHASNATRFEQGYRNIAAVAKIPGRDDPKCDILELVQKWLCDETNGSWLMVLDNADDIDTFFNTFGHIPLVDYLPSVSHGSILITSRNQTAARNIVGPDGQVISVKPMSTDDAISLLKTRIMVNPSDETEAQLLVEALECIPLAITQAGAYISNRSPRLSLSTYLQLFQQSESNQEHLLNYDDAHDLRRDRSIRHPVITTWQISFDQIHRICPKATDLLAVMSMFDRQGILESLISQSMHQLEFEDTVAPLLSFSLIQVEIGGQCFQIHRLVQLSIQQWLKKRGQSQRFLRQALRIMKEKFPSGDYETWESCQMLLPHLNQMMRFTKEIEEDDQLNLSSIADRCGWYLYLRGKYDEAETMHQQALTARESVLGAEHLDTLTSINNLGLVLSRQGKYKEAEIIHQQALVGRENVLGADHPNTLTCVGILGWVFLRQGKYKEAEIMQWRALSGREKVLGTEHPDTLISASILGSVMSRQGKYEEAAVMHRKALAGREKALGAEHPDTLSSINNLGSVLRCLGKYEEAAMMHQQALVGRQKVLGTKHPHTLGSVNNIGLVLEKQGHYEKAIMMHHQALAGRQKVLGTEHPNTLASMNNLGLALEKQGKYEDAASMHKQALLGREKVLGTEHPNTLSSVNNFGLVLEKQGRFEEAANMHKRALSSREKVLGAKHPNTIASANNLIRVLEKQGKGEAAAATFTHHGKHGGSALM